MSIGAFRWAKTWELPTLQKFVLVMIADHYNDADHRSWPSRATIARETGMSVKSVTRSIQQLEQDGLIEVEPWLNVSTGSQLANRYCLPLYDHLSEPSEALPVRVTAAFAQSGQWEVEAE
jgi:DNA-binding transcriptional MocR family regulator